MTDKQPEALRLAELFELEDDPESLYRKAAAELRRLHAAIEVLKARLDALRDELREATEAMDDPEVNNQRTLAWSIRMLRADAERYRWLASKAHKNTAHDRYENGAYWSISFFSNDSRHSLTDAIAAAREAK